MVKRDQLAYLLVKGKKLVLLFDLHLDINLLRGPLGGQSAMSFALPLMLLQLLVLYLLGVFFSVVEPHLVVSYRLVVEPQLASSPCEMVKL